MTLPAGASRTSGATATSRRPAAGLPGNNGLVLVLDATTGV
ncbi:hypothetical protein OHS18_00185 [Amycolatopsis sp. NBC_00355]